MSGAETAKKTRTNREERQQTILAAAQKVFVEHGYHNAAMDEIATAAGVSKPIVYQYFPGKHDLYLALLERNVSFLVSALETTLTESEAETADGRVSNKQAVRDVVHSYFAFAEKENGAFRMVYECDLTADADVAKIIKQANRAFAQTLTAAILRSSKVSNGQARLLAHAMIGLARASALHWINEELELSLDEAAETTFQLAWDGLVSFPDANPLPSQSKPPKSSE